MSAADGWDLRIPRDASELEDLWADVRQHGVEPGGRLRVLASTDDGPPALASTPQRRLRFAGVIKDGPSDLSTDTDRYLAGGFGER